MKLQIYSIYDRASRTYNTPFFTNNDLTATRMFKGEVNRPDTGNLVHQNPEDFSLFRLGNYDPDTGVIEPEQTAVITAIQVIEKA